MICIDDVVIQCTSSFTWYPISSIIWQSTTVVHAYDILYFRFIHVRRENDDDDDHHTKSFVSSCLTRDFTREATSRERVREPCGSRCSWRGTKDGIETRDRARHRGSCLLHVRPWHLQRKCQLCRLYHSAFLRNAICSTAKLQHDIYIYKPVWWMIHVMCVCACSTHHLRLQSIFVVFLEYHLSHSIYCDVMACCLVQVVLYR